jgi:hypothetical protein
VDIASPHVHGTDPPTERLLCIAHRSPRRGDKWSNVDSLYPGEAIIDVKGRPGRALGDQIRSIEKCRLKAGVSSLTADEMARIDEALAITLGLPSRDVAEIAFAARISR